MAIRPRTGGTIAIVPYEIGAFNEHYTIIFDDYVVNFFPLFNDTGVKW